MVRVAALVVVLVIGAAGPAFAGHCVDSAEADPCTVSGTSTTTTAATTTTTAATTTTTIAATTTTAATTTAEDEDRRDAPMVGFALLVFAAFAMLGRYL